MSRLSRRLSAYKEQGRKALISFITAGDPHASATVPALHALVKGGVDVLELGMPFSDPEADGPAIQRASERALANKIRLADVLRMVREFREDDPETPVLLMGYLNPIMRMGFEPFVDAAASAGVDALIIVNLPPEEADDLRAILSRHDIDLVFLIAPTTTPERAQLIGRASSGFVYYVSLKGVTGADLVESDALAQRVESLRACTDLPILVGFGIKDAASAKRTAAIADGVVVGTVLVNTMASMANDLSGIPDALTEQVRELRDAIDPS